MNKKRETYLIILALVIGAILRFVQLGQNPVSLYWDEAAIGLDAYSINESGLDMNGKPWLQPVLGSYGDFKAPVLIWLVSLSVHFLGMTAFAIRLPVTLFSVLTIYLVYLLVKELLTFDEQLAKRYRLMPLLTALLVAISPWSVHFGRIAMESSLSVSFLLLALLFFIKAIKNKNYYFLLSVFFAVIAVYAYYSLRVIVPLFCFALICLFAKKLKTKKKYLIFSIAAFVLAVLPILKSPYYARSQDYRLNNDNLIRHQRVIAESSQYLESYGSNLYSRLVYHRYLLVMRDFLSNVASHFSVDFLFLKGDSNLRQHSGYFGELFLVALPFFYWGIFLLFKNLKSKLASFLLIFMCLAPIPAAMVYEVPHASRAIYLFIPFLILTAWGINEFINRAKKLAVCLVVALFLVNATFYYADYFIDYPKRSSEAWLYSYNQVTLYLKDHYQDFSSIEIDERYWLPSIFVYYQFPELIAQIRDLKNALLNDPINSFGLPDPFDYLLSEADIDKPKAKFVYYQQVPEDYTVIKDFDFLNGDKSLVLAIKEVKTN